MKFIVTYHERVGLLHSMCQYFIALKSKYLQQIKIVGNFLNQLQFINLLLCSKKKDVITLK